MPCDVLYFHMPQKDADAHRAYMRAWHAANKEHVSNRKKAKWRSDIDGNRARDNAKRLAIKEEVLRHYGPACRCCGITEMVFLTLDHVDGVPVLPRDRTDGGIQLYRRVRREGYPTGFQTLCWNCNYAKSNGGCPHVAN